MDALQILEKLSGHLKKSMSEGLGKAGFKCPVDQNDTADNHLREICLQLEAFSEMVAESYQFSEELACGNLQAKASRMNIFAMPLKGLQANLNHLTWQANQVAEGDYNQKVQFLGDFSHSFNRMTEALREKELIEQKFKIITDVLGIGIFLVDCKGTVLFSNPEISKMLKCSPDELTESNVQDHISRQDLTPPPPSLEDDPLFSAISNGIDFSNEGTLICKDSTQLPVIISSRPIYKNKVIDGAVVTFRDNSEQKKYLQSLETINKLLEAQATTDALTGISNRIKYDEALNAEIARTHRHQGPLSLIIFDIDHFKKVNDTYGHTAGDNVLKQLSTLVSANVRETDVFARWGGEEFVVLTPGISLTEAITFAEKLCSLIARYNFNTPEHITASFGVTCFQQGDNNLSFLNRADKALYHAKQNGRNQVHSMS